MTYLASELQPLINSRNTLTIEQRKALRDYLLQKVKEQNVELSLLIKVMRRVTGKSHAEYAKMHDISHSTLKRAELGEGNLTADTLNKIGKPFGLTVGFVSVR